LGRGELEVFGAREERGDLLFEAAGIGVAFAFDLAYECVEFGELLCDRRDEFADAFAGARGGRFAQFRFGAFEQGLDGVLLLFGGLGERGLQARGERLGRACGAFGIAAELFFALHP